MLLHLWKMMIIRCFMAFPLMILPIHGWGREGHEIVANLAWKLLSNHTQLQVIGILKKDVTHQNNDDDDDEGNNYAADGPALCDDCSPLGMIADWADAVRNTYAYHWSGPLHYIDVRDDLVVDGGCPAGVNDHMDTASCRFDYGRDCPLDFCAAGAIGNYTHLLMQLHGDHAKSTITRDRDNGNTKKNSQLLQESLKFLTHFIGDIHQPLHASRTSDRGGNSILVTFHPDDNDHNIIDYSRRLRRGTTEKRNVRSQNQRLDYPTNLHGVWDDNIIEKCMHDDFAGSRANMEDHLWSWLLQNYPYWIEWLNCPDGGNPKCTTLWGQESFEFAIEWAYRNVDGTEIQSGTTLSHEYYESRLPIVKQRLVAAGVRLAVTLEIALQGSFDHDALRRRFSALQ